MPTERRAAAAALMLTALALAGCVSPATDLETQAALGTGLLAADVPLWIDPQNAPHPLFGWPTLVNPATEGASEWWLPIAAAELPDPIAGIDHITGTDGVQAGAGIALFGGLALVPGYSDTSYVVDIRDPASPVVLSKFEPTQGPHRGAAIVAYPDGRLVGALSTGAGFELWDITDPKAPVQVAAVETSQGGHKLGIVPGTPVLYNANSRGGQGTTPALRPEDGQGLTEIYDLTDPAAPVLVQEFKNGFGCHHIFFWNSVDKQRAICAGIQFAQIWDVADPRAPVVITNVPIPLGDPMFPSLRARGPMPFAHFSALNADGTVLVVGDELGGGSQPPGCTVAGAPTGALWFYDVSDETQPSLLGWYSPGHHIGTNVQTSCTAHHGRLVPDPAGRDLLAMSFYGAGVVLVDFSDPSAAKMVDQFYDGSNTWETWYYNGYLFTGDLARGMDVFTFA